MLLFQVLLFVGLVLLLLGVMTPLWTVVAAVRAARHRLRDEPSTIGFAVDRSAVVDRAQVAVLIAAHDEELVIAATLRSAATQVAPAQIFVASDASTDRTADMARAFGANVLELVPNRGKAGALAAAIEHFRLAERFEVVMLLDADTELSHDYLATGLPLFAEPQVVAVAGTAASNRVPGPTSVLGGLFVAYRQRVYVVVQYLQKFGQAARDLNAVTIVPGFASMYRTRVLSRIDIAAPGLCIEDFNMTFEVHAKRLGRIAFVPGTAVAYTQDPDTFHDYRRQVRRWSLGFWQTVKRHTWHRDRFWVALGLSIMELVIGSAVYLAVVPVILVALVAAGVAAAGWDPTGTAETTATMLPAPLLIAGVLVPDYVFTVIAAVTVGRPWFLLLGFVFPFVRLVDAWTCLAQLFAVLRSDSSGVWTSPARRGTVSVSEPVSVVR